jgi:GTP-dependent phosphoenolpyruvate carboxykinase
MPQDLFLSILASATVVFASFCTVENNPTAVAVLFLVVQIVQSVLGDDQAFKQASGDAFTTVVNADMGKFSVMQMLAAYCDNILKVVLLLLC